MSLKQPRYLGDGVYAAVESHGSVRLTTGSHKLAESDNVLYLDPNVMDALAEYLEKCEGCGLRGLQLRSVMGGPRECENCMKRKTVP